MSSLISHAKKELELAGMFSKGSDYDGMLGDAVLELIALFSKQGHSGCSAGMTVQLFQKLADFKPLAPLTLKDDEWNETIGGSFQNRRNSAVFKNGKDSEAYYINAYTTKTQTGSCWSGCLELKDGRRISRCYIKDVTKMPTIMIDVIEKEVAKDDWEMTVKDEAQLDELAKYYTFTFEPKQGKE